MVASFSSSKRSLMKGMGYLSLIVMMFSWQ